MADSNITKRALSAALKELLLEEAFEKISVADICEKCAMNRKSFYYHFKDKYDLANWIFDTEFIELIQSPLIDDVNTSFEERWSGIEVVCEYFYKNRNFYRKLLKVVGQNSFSEHFREFIHPILKNRVESIIGENDIPDMVFDFIVDGLECAIERWLLDKNCVSAQEFANNLKQLLRLAIVGLENRIAAMPTLLDKIKNDK